MGDEADRGAEILDVAAAQRKARENAERDAAFRDESKQIGEGADLRPFPRIWTLEKMVEEAVFIADGTQVALLGEPRLALPFKAFEQWTAASRMSVPTEDGKIASRRVATLWLEHRRRLNVLTQTFAPGRPDFTMSPDNHLALNIWRAFPEVQAHENWGELAAYFLAHVEYLVPDSNERGMLLDYLAHIQQRPGELPHSHYLFITPTQGIGRNLFGAWLARVWPGYVALNMDLPAILRGDFNDRLSCKVLAQVDELHETAGAEKASVYRAAERLKTLLTREITEINPKYGRRHREFNCMRWLLFSNHDGAVFLDGYDRRIRAIRCPDKPQPAEYYSANYRRCEDPQFIASIRKFLADRDLSKFNPGALPPMNQAKADVIAAGRSEVDQAVIEFVEWWGVGGAVAAASDIRRFVYPGADDDEQRARRDSAAIRFAADRAGMKALERRVRISTIRERVWSLRDHERWRAATNADLVQEIEDARANSAHRESEEIQTAQKDSEKARATRPERTAQAVWSKAKPAVP